MTANEPTKLSTIDPVCGMTVDPAKTASLEHQGTKYHFCCQGCLMKFQAEPARYLHPKQPTPLIQLSAKKVEVKADYTCPMHPRGA